MLLCGACMMGRDGGSASGSRSTPEPTPCATVDHPLPSPSGRFILQSLVGPIQNGVETRFAVITTATGERQFITERPLSLRHGVCFLWSPGEDIAWIGSKDVGLHVYESDDSTGEWREIDPRGLDPSVVPELMRINHPHAFT